MKTATRPGRVGGLGDEPGGGPPELPVVGPDVAGAVRSGLIGDVGDDRLAPGLERLDRLADQRMIRRDHGDRVARLAEEHESLGDVLGIEPVGEFDDRLDLLVASLACRLPDLLGDQLIQLPVRLLQQEAEPIAGASIPSCARRWRPFHRSRSRRLPPERAGSSLGRTDAEPAEDAIDGRDADAGGPGEISDGRSVFMLPPIVSLCII